MRSTTFFSVAAHREAVRSAVSQKQRGDGYICVSQLHERPGSYVKTHFTAFLPVALGNWEILVTVL